MQIFLIVIGGLLLADSLFAATQSNFNMGVIMPGILGLPLLLWGVFFVPLAQAEGAWTVVKFVVLTAYLLFILLLTVCVSMMLSAPRATMEEKADAVIVLGAAVRGDQMSLTLQKRTDLAVEYLKRHPDAVCVVSGGQGRAEDLSEAEAMGRYMKEQGIEEDRILLEDKATSTQENFEFSKKLLDARLGEGNYKALFSTSDVHVYRAGLMAQKAGLTCKGLAAPSTWYMIPNFYLRETAAIVHYSILGR